MARKTGPSPILFTLPSSGITATVYSDDVQIKFATRDFDRQEWVNSKLQQSMDVATFAKPIIVTNAVNAPVQVAQEGCGFSSSVPLGPDDSNLSNILQRQNIKEYQISGTPSSPSAVQSLLNISNDHRARLDQFDAYLAELGQNVSYQFLLNLRNQNFSYLTTTGLSASGIDINETNTCLISSFQSGVVFFDPYTSTARATGWSMTVQVINFSTRINQY